MIAKIIFLFFILNLLDLISYYFLVTQIQLKLQRTKIILLFRYVQNYFKNLHFVRSYNLNNVLEI
ncbi:hypothetical protein BWK59_11380 [Flavobacterium davisii]|uniref:Uncharacterized protein n=1 Tax=Flavobacterium davisii TaxID=2906077 RepID=A0A246GGH1_9FLAO|nr:hypothetical protein BWK59_11380 [Flavobacterium davisii]